VVFVVVNLHGLSINKWFERIERITERRQGKAPSASATKGARKLGTQSRNHAQKRGAPKSIPAAK